LVNTFKLNQSAMVYLNACLFSLFELDSFLTALGGISWGIGVSTNTGESAVFGNQVFVANRLVIEVALQDFANTSGITGLSRQSGA